MESTFIFLTTLWKQRVEISNNKTDSEKANKCVFGKKSKQNNRPWLCNCVEYKKHCTVSWKSWVMCYLSPLFENYDLKSLEFVEFHFWLYEKEKTEGLAFTKHLPHAMYYSQCFQCIDHWILTTPQEDVLSRFPSYTWINDGT